MRLCFFADGRNEHLQRLALGLAALGNRVSIVTHKPVAVPGVSVEKFEVPRPGIRHPFRWNTRYRRYLQGQFRKNDVVILFFLHDWGFDAAIIEGQSFVASPRGSDIVPPPGETPPSEELKALRVDLLRHACAVGTAGRRFGEIVAEFAGLDFDRIERLPIGVDLRRFDPARFCNERSDEVTRLGFFKGFREVYGAADIIRALPTIVDRNPTVRVDMVGDGPTLPTCKDLAVRLGVSDRLEWHGRKPHAEIPGILARCTLSLMPSRCESFGVAALESSAMGVPVVATNVGGLPDTVSDGVTGVLVPPHSPESLASATIELLGNAARRSKMQETGREWVAQRYAWGQVLRQWVQVCEKTRDSIVACV